MSKSGSTALHSAATKGHAGTCALLLNRGAELDARDAFGYEPLHYAGQNGHADVCALLLGHGAMLGAAVRYGAPTPQPADRAAPSSRTARRLQNCSLRGVRFNQDRPGTEAPRIPRYGRWVADQA